MKRKVLVLGICVLAAMTLQAYDYPYLLFQNADNSVVAMDVTNMTLTVSNGSLVVTNANGTQSFTLSSLSRMYFGTSDTATALDKVVDSVENGAKKLDVYTLTGSHVGRFQSLSEASLSQGVYVVRKENETVKIVVR